MNRLNRLTAKARNKCGADARPGVILIIHRESGEWEMQVSAWVNCKRQPKSISCSCRTLDEAIEEAQKIVDQHGGDPAIIVDNMIDQED